jgi:hypothetical protein
MKKIITSLFLATAFLTSQAQFDLKKLAKKDSSGTILQNVSKSFPSGSGKLSNEDIINGLKEALSTGTTNSTRILNKPDGFFANAAIKILMPDEAKKVESTLRNFGMSSVVDKAILSMNRAAEDAAGGVSAIFLDAIKKMTVTDGLNILQGGDFAATEFLKKMTTSELTLKMRPVIEASLKKVDATEHWNTVFSNYNKFSNKKVDTDLAAYVTAKALDGLFHSISLEEQKIRKDPAAQVTDLLKRVFGGK